MPTPSPIFSCLAPPTLFITQHASGLKYLRESPQSRPGPRQQSAAHGREGASLQAPRRTCGLPVCKQWCHWPYSFAPRTGLALSSRKLRLLLAAAVARLLQSALVHSCNRSSKRRFCTTSTGDIAPGEIRGTWCFWNGEREVSACTINIISTALQKYLYIV